MWAAWKARRCAGPEGLPRGAGRDGLWVGPERAGPARRGRGGPRRAEQVLRAAGGESESF